MATHNPSEQDDIPGSDTPEESVTLRDEIDAAFEQHATDETPEEETRITERSRDGKGRFAPKAGEEGAQQADPTAKPADPTQQAQQQPQQAGTPAPPPGTFKAPAAWKPAQREKWAAVPQDVQSEITRREGEYQRTLEEAAEARKFVQAFEQVTRPYEMFIRAENSNPLAAVQNLMQTAANLRVGTPQHKAQMVAEICRTYAVDIGQLDAILTAQQNGVPWAQYQAAQTQQNPQQFRDPRLDQFLANQERERQQRDQYEQQQLRSTLDTFANSHEFYSDVADTMALLVEHASARGLPVDLEKFYSQACQMDPDINKILTARGGNTNSRGGNGNTSPQSQAVLRAKRAAVSVRGDSTPSGSTVPKNDSIRAAIEAAFTAGDE